MALTRIILSGRRINDDMGKYVAESLVKNLIKADIPVKGARVIILGFTFKENCPDTRNTKVIDIVKELQEYGISPLITDPVADYAEAEREYGITFAKEDELKDADAVILAVSHKEYETLTMQQIDGFYAANGRQKVLSDIKGMLDKDAYEKAGYLYWRL